MKSKDEIIAELCQSIDALLVYVEVGKGSRGDLHVKEAEARVEEARKTLGRK